MLQRSAFNQNKLSVHKVLALDKIGFLWSLSQYKWQKNFEDLLVFKQKYGNFNVPTAYKENPKLGNWVRKLRFQYRCVNMEFNKRITLTENQIKKLNQIDFVWDLDEDFFNLSIDNLMQYKGKYSHVHVPEDCKEYDNIGKWARETRKAYKSYCKGIRHRNSLSRERIFLLEKLGFQWSSADAKWMEKYDKLLKYHERFGDCFVPKKYDCNLYNFVNIQRRDYRLRFDGETGTGSKGTDKKKKKTGSGISDKRMRLLEAIGFIFEINKSQK